jgi:hypothetical protein
MRLASASTSTRLTSLSTSSLRRAFQTSAQETFKAGPWGYTPRWPRSLRRSRRCGLLAGAEGSGVSSTCRPLSHSQPLGPHPLRVGLSLSATAAAAAAAAAATSTYALSFYLRCAVGRVVWAVYIWSCPQGCRGAEHSGGVRQGGAPAAQQHKGRRYDKRSYLGLAPAEPQQLRYAHCGTCRWMDGQSSIQTNSIALGPQRQLATPDDLSDWPV